jgi:hypothetical protein
MKTVRLQFEVNEDRLEKIDDLMKKLDLKRRAELFNHGLSLLNWAINEREKGRIIASMDEEKGTYKELEIPIWSLVTR